DNAVDMGTGFDCFDAASYTASAAIGAEARRWRNVLLAAMRKQGFANYDHEWWHFSYAGSAGAPAYDFPIRALAHVCSCLKHSEAAHTRCSRLSRLRGRVGEGELALTFM